VVSLATPVGKSLRLGSFSKRIRVQKASPTYLAIITPRMVL
jgi:hypothetical protein